MGALGLSSKVQGLPAPRCWESSTLLREDEVGVLDPDPEECGAWGRGAGKEPGQGTPPTPTPESLLRKSPWQLTIKWFLII